MSTRSTPVKPRQPTPAARLSSADRYRDILSGAIAYFAEAGLAGDTVGLAKRLGITQPLLYRYFESKEALIGRVFEETFLTNWNPLWEEILTNAAVPLPERLLAFHRDFARVHLQRDRVRLSVFFALGGWDMSPYFRLMWQQVYVPIATGLRQYAKADTPTKRPLRDTEIELAKGVIEKIQYYGIREWIYDLPVPKLDPIIEAGVYGMLEGAPAAMRQFASAGEIAKPPVRPKAKSGPQR